MLQIKDIHTHIGGSHILQGVSMDIPKGEVIALLGRNGVGKTTLIHSIIGFRPVRSGNILFEDKEISSLPAHKVVRLGIGLVPQGRRIFASLTVMENLLVPYRFSGGSKGGDDIERVFEMFPALRERKNQRGTNFRGVSSRCWPPPARSW